VLASLVDRAQRNLVYTGVSRGKRLVMPLRQRNAPAIAVKVRQTRRRWSKSHERLPRKLLANVQIALDRPKSDPSF
jgi:hypothetical protein